MDEVEALGLIKIDVLGLATKTAIAMCVKMVKERYGIDIHVGKIPLDDPGTLALINSGRTDGCFQLENPGMKNALKEIGIDSFDDLVLTIAMYRPGPKQYIPEIGRRKKGQSPIVTLHPEIGRITAKTYGIMVYQEQIMQVFMALADMSPVDGYKFLKGCAKKKESLIMAYKDKFLSAATKNTTSDIAGRVWNDLEKFAGYSFNKSHSVSYAYESWVTAYLKAHYPTEFIAARLSVETLRRDFEMVAKFESDAISNFGFSFSPIDINTADICYRIISPKQLMRPLVAKDVGIKAAEAIRANQPFPGSDMLLTFTRKLDREVNSKIIEAMFSAGMWPNWSKAPLLDAFDRIKADLKKMRGRPTGDLFEDD
jgi:DNA polymerase-3 subunit alpha